MRIRRDNKGKDIIVSCKANIEKPVTPINQTVLLNSLMEDYGIPLGIEMATNAFKAIAHDLKNTDKKTYLFTLVAQDVTESKVS